MKSLFDSMDVLITPLEDKVYNMDITYRKYLVMNFTIIDTKFGVAFTKVKIGAIFSYFGLTLDEVSTFARHKFIYENPLKK